MFHIKFLFITYVLQNLSSRFLISCFVFELKIKLTFIIVGSHFLNFKNMLVVFVPMTFNHM